MDQTDDDDSSNSGMSVRSNCYTGQEVHFRRSHCAKRTGRTEYRRSTNFVNMVRGVVEGKTILCWQSKDWQMGLTWFDGLFNPRKLRQGRREERGRRGGGGEEERGVVGWVKRMDG